MNLLAHRHFDGTFILRPKIPTSPWKIFQCVAVCVGILFRERFYAAVFLCLSAFEEMGFFSSVLRSFTFIFLIGISLFKLKQMKDWNERELGRSNVASDQMSSFLCIKLLSSEKLKFLSENAFRRRCH